MMLGARQKNCILNWSRSSRQGYPLKTWTFFLSFFLYIQRSRFFLYLYVFELFFVIPKNSGLIMERIFSVRPTVCTFYFLTEKLQKYKKHKLISFYLFIFFWGGGYFCDFFSCSLVHSQQFVLILSSGRECGGL